ncbi:MAG: hypothetical protein MN733_43450 [Nitrososphaera sp.]|nr:hypothetical protein [Nitrososphaera sp.]
MTEDQIADLIQRTFGKRPGRVRLPGLPVEYDERTERELVTPMRAMQLIAATWDRYPDARNFYPTKIEKIVKYGQDMEAGKWEYRPDGDPIVITDGIVTGGRHRLHAVLLSHKSIESNIKYKNTKEN